MRTSLFITASLIVWLASSFAYAESPIRPGDRIAIVGNTFADQLRVHGYLETLLLEHTKGKPVSIRNLGWGGDMLTARDRPTNFPTEESTLIDHRTDVIIACFGMGESFAGEQGLSNFTSNLIAFIASHAGKSYNGKSEVRLILVSPIAYEDLGELTPSRGQRNRELAAYTAAMRQVAEDAAIPFVNLFEQSRYLMDESEGPNLTDNGIHLNPLGYWAISRDFYSQLVTHRDGASSQPWRLTIDAASETGEAVGIELAAIKRNEGVLSFQATETTAPTLPPPTDQRLSPPLELRRDTLVIRNLTPGEYQLSVDGQSVATADAKTWADGVAIDASPAHRELENYRAAVNDKNLQFVYSWKALNQVHIVGERMRSPSGRALPQEVIEFARLASEREQNLLKGYELKTRSWRLERIEGGD